MQVPLFFSPVALLAILPFYLVLCIVHLFFYHSHPLSVLYENQSFIPTRNYFNSKIFLPGNQLAIVSWDKNVLKTWNCTDSLVIYVDKFGFVSAQYDMDLRIGSRFSCVVIFITNCFMESYQQLKNFETRDLKSESPLFCVFWEIKSKLVFSRFQLISIDELWMKQTEILRIGDTFLEIWYG